jgi:hypothetical protein
MARTAVTIYIDEALLNIITRRAGINSRSLSGEVKDLVIAGLSAQSKSVVKVLSLLDRLDDPRMVEFRDEEPPIR